MKPTEQAWSQFVTKTIENLYFDDVLLDRWSSEILHQGGRSAKLSSLAKYFIELRDLRTELVNAKNAVSVKNVVLKINEFVDSIAEKASDALYSEEDAEMQRMVLLLAMQEASKASVFDSEKKTVSKQSDLREKIKTALTSQANIEEAVRRFCSSMGYPEEADAKIIEAFREYQASDALLEILAYAADVNKDERGPLEKQEDIDDFIMATEPEDAEPVQYEEWVRSVALSLGVPPEYVTSVLSRVVRPEKGSSMAPASSAERKLAPGAQFGLNYLTLYNSGLEGGDPEWPIWQYANLSGFVRKEGGAK